MSLLNQKPSDYTPENIFVDDTNVAYYKPKKPALDINGKPFVEGGRVVTVVPTKEYEVIYRTFHKNPDIQAIYEEFKMVDNKLFWLSENRGRLSKFDINVDALIEAHS